MNKTKIVLCAIGGVALVAALALGYLTYDALSAKVEQQETLDDARSGVDRLLRSEVYPGGVSCRMHAANEAKVSQWLETARKAASAGDRVFPEMTPAAFKDAIVGQAREIRENVGGRYPGGVDGRLVSPKFAFGPFDPFVNGAKMPAEKDVRRLQRQWDDLMLFADVLATNGATEFVEIALKSAASTEENADEPPRNAAGRRKAAAKKRAAKKAAASAGKLPLSDTWLVTFRTRGPALVRTLNALASTNRFIVVDDVAIARDGDPILAAVGAGEKTAAATPTARQTRKARRQRGAAAAADAKSKAPATDGRRGEVTNPLTEPPCKVTLTCTVYDFRTLEDADAADVGEEEGK